MFLWTFPFPHSKISRSIRETFCTTKIFRTGTIFLVLFYIEKLKINFFLQFSDGIFFTFDFHFNFFALMFVALTFCWNSLKAFSFFHNFSFLQVLGVLRHTSSQGESFRSFWDAATYDKLYSIVKQSFVIVVKVKNPFQSASRLHQHTIHSSDFPSVFVSGSVRTLYPSPTSVFTTTIDESGWRNYVFVFQEENILMFFVCLLLTPKSAELWQGNFHNKILFWIFNDFYF